MSYKSINTDGDYALPFLRFETAYQEELSLLEQHILHHVHDIELWFREAWKNTPPPLMSSVDLRHGGQKIAPVDTNLFPAGFNNLSEDVIPLCVQALQTYLFQIHPTCRSVLLIPEAHTRNQYYFKSLSLLADLFKKAGFNLRFGHWSLESEFDGLRIEKIERRDDALWVGNHKPCLVVLNNDLSEGIPPCLLNLSQRTFPDPKMGWDLRRKSNHFGYYKKIAHNFTKLINIEPWLLTPEIATVQQVNFLEKRGLEAVAVEVDKMLADINLQYQKHHVNYPPFVVVKPDNGTYGMGIMSVKNGEEILTINRKQRNNMARIKGGQEIHSVLVQEGVYTLETMKDGAVAEPVIYMIGPHVVGGFYRVHKNKGNDQNLNSPGMHFEPLAFDLACNVPTIDTITGSLAATKANRFYVYGVIARLAALAAACEEQEE